MRRIWGILALLFVALCLTRTSVLAAPLSGRAPARPLLRSMPEDVLCSRALMLRHPDRCPPYGPGLREVRLARLRARLPDPLPALPVERLPSPEGAVTAFTYGQITPLPAPTYRHPAEAAAGMAPVRTFVSNINWVSVRGRVEYGGELWYQINAEEYIQATHLQFPEPSRFQGVVVTAQPAQPFGWLRRDLSPSPTPGAPPTPGLTLPRRTIVAIFATGNFEGQRWDMIGPDQWVRHDFVAQVTPKTAPPGVPAGVKWIEVDTYEQTLAAYEGERLVYATLTTTGRPIDLTPLGLFRIFRKVRGALMQSIDRPMDDRYWYYLEDVEHAQFFNDRISFHAAYWHDAFGTVRSNGCINLAPLDARWLYGWTDPQLSSSGSWVTAEAAGEGQTWVWVHHSAPDLRAKPAP